jgi:eukaryotic-like serine/threonine-protein kinase
MIGQLVADRFEVEELLGTGGMSSVFRARDRVLDRSVALKIIHEHFSRDPEYVERFRREARAIARLTHPNIVTVIDRGEFQGRQYIVFEHVRGETLKDLLRREGPLPVERALGLTEQIARGLAFAHGHGIVHRDVKPQNVLLDEDGGVKVTDFGIARSLDAGEALTETGAVLGTGDYIAPEQASGQPVDERSDQYSLGVLLYELLTGEVPYRGDNPMTVAMRHLRDPVPSARERRPEIAPAVDELVRRALAKDPDERFPSMEALVAALARAPERTAGAAPTATIAPPPRRARTPSTRARTPALALLVAVLALGAIGLGLVVRGLGEGDDGADAAGGGSRVRLEATRDHDPLGDGREHPEDVPLATDGDPSTYWETESYSSFGKEGVGLVLDAGAPRELATLVVVTDTPGFRARIQAGEAPEGPFVDVSAEQTAAERATFELGAGEYRYYVVWITEPNGKAHVNEVRARA